MAAWVSLPTLPCILNGTPLLHTPSNVCTGTIAFSNWPEDGGGINSGTLHFHKLQRIKKKVNFKNKVRLGPEASSYLGSNIYHFIRKAPILIYLWRTWLYAAASKGNVTQEGSSVFSGFQLNLFTSDTENWISKFCVEYETDNFTAWWRSCLKEISAKL
jgi:hypothetical protein